MTTLLPIVGALAALAPTSVPEPTLALVTLAAAQEADVQLPPSLVPS